MTAPAGSALRARAARVLVAVLGEGRSLKAQLGPALAALQDTRDRALLEAICFSALRHRRRYEFVLSAWLAKPLAKRDFPVHCLLLTGLAQMDAPACRRMRPCPPRRKPPASWEGRRWSVS